MNRLKRTAILKISDNAANRLKYLLKDKNTDQTFVKIGIKRRGCNGLSYTMNYVDQINKLDELVEDKVIDNKAVMYLLGTEMDYIEDDVKAEFVFNNPNSKGSCGCGESFNI